MPFDADSPMTREALQVVLDAFHDYCVRRDLKQSQSTLLIAMATRLLAVVIDALPKDEARAIMLNVLQTAEQMGSTEVNL
jgi:hypothetical protein